MQFYFWSMFQNTEADLRGQTQDSWVEQELIRWRGGLTEESTSVWTSESVDRKFSAAAVAAGLNSAVEHDSRIMSREVLK